MKIAIQMDHISTLQIQGDTTFALALAAQERGYSLFHYTPDRLSMRDGCVIVKLEALTVHDKEGNHYQLGKPIRTQLMDMDVVLLRQDPPFDLNYITTTHLLECIHPKTLVVNDPAWVRNSPEKIFVTEFPDLMPETLITKDIEEITAFRATFGEIIVKPLYGNGGAGVFHLKQDDRNLASLLEIFAQIYREPFIVQRYLDAVRKGDKRIILLDGKPVGAINRIAAETDVRSNMHVGGRAENVDLTKRDYEICQRIGPALKERGLLLVGIDVIGDYITEINVTSPTGIREIKRFSGTDIAHLFWDVIEFKRSN
ncbi:glutathione synthetase [Bartonella henselae]|uniref:Glutathione synthetase n=1 Tax=Bartonella henselae (strain ATCC 49882 / DSM 28221 / CCUG 30454 / Houston 1) TaxID=283166 RepID=A0A0H3LW64_BARHE|nr:glutathione synthase [Bartonella henselae]ATP11876.1 glutathione synthase [Bartonella henselae]ETS07604.1 glutathione synthetase [Bartonella henselae JK 42]ETS10194.1 glutathione synthetase [Bartonella henselae JK 50]ETS10701.1 glutathione synthetase [Bartonella henselae JK 51]ETS16407.1 glutathione synthetase [Bartonella henselae JK 41]